MKTNEHDQPFLLSANDLARLLGIHRSSVFALRNRGHLPRPVRLGRSVRWRRDEVQSWISADCPPREKWESIKKGATERENQRKPSCGSNGGSRHE